MWTFIVTLTLADVVLAFFTAVYVTVCVVFLVRFLRRWWKRKHDLYI